MGPESRRLTSQTALSGSYEREIEHKYHNPQQARPWLRERAVWPVTVAEAWRAALVGKQGATGRWTRGARVSLRTR